MANPSSFAAGLARMTPDYTEGISTATYTIGPQPVTYEVYMAYIATQQAALLARQSSQLAELLAATKDKS